MDKPQAQNLNKETSIERARTSQRNFIAGYLNGKYGSTTSKDAELVAFVTPDGSDWRFSLVKMEYRFEQAKSGKVKVKGNSSAQPSFPSWLRCCSARILTTRHSRCGSALLVPCPEEKSSDAE